MCIFSPSLVSVIVTTIPGQADHCWVGVAVAAKNSVGVGEGDGVAVVGAAVFVFVGVDVGMEVGMDANVAVSIIGVSVESAVSIFFVFRLHALSGSMAMNINRMKYFFICMAASGLVLNKKTQELFLARLKNYSIKKIMIGHCAQS
jgi:hypothetical protein